MPFAASGTMSSCACHCRYVQLKRVHLPGRVAGNGDGGTEGDGHISPSAIQQACSRSRQVPHPHRAVAAAADRGPPVRADRRRVDRAGVAGQFPRCGGPGQVPDPHRAVAAAADRDLPVRADRQRVDLAAWPVSSRGGAVPARSHTRTVPSLPPLTAIRPSALTATVSTQPAWPVSSRGAAVPARSHTRTVPPGRR